MHTVIPLVAGPISPTFNDVLSHLFQIVPASVVLTDHFDHASWTGHTHRKAYGLGYIINYRCLGHYPNLYKSTTDRIGTASTPPEDPDPGPSFSCARKPRASLRDAFASGSWESSTPPIKGECEGVKGPTYDLSWSCKPSSPFLASSPLGNLWIRSKHEHGKTGRRASEVLPNPYGSPSGTPRPP